MKQQRLPDWASATLFSASMVGVILAVVYVNFTESPFPRDAGLGCVFFWPFPIVLSAFFNSRPDPRRTVELRVYALLTGLGVGVALPGPSPSGSDPFILPTGILLGLMLFYPSVLLIEGIAQWVYSWGRQLVDDSSAPNRWSNPMFLSAVSMFLATMVVVPPVIHREMSEHRRRRTIDRANESWPNQVEFFENMPWRFVAGDDFEIMYQFDRDTGLPLRSSRNKQITQWHNQQIQQLIRRNGPAANAVAGLPTEKQLRQMLDGESTGWITDFPVVSPLGRVRLDTRPGATQRELLIGVDFKVDIAAEDRELAIQWTPTLVFVRQGSDLLEVYTTTGELVLRLETWPPEPELRIEVVSLTSLEGKTQDATSASRSLLNQFSIRSCQDSDLAASWREQENAIHIHVDDQPQILVRRRQTPDRHGFNGLTLALREMRDQHPGEIKVLLTAERDGWDTPIQEKVLDLLPTQNVELFLIRERATHRPGSPPSESP